MRNSRIVLTLLFCLMLVACGIDNTMYNARNYFKSAQARALNANGRPTPQAVDEYTRAIQKCGIILSRNSKGKRADDALFLMARALYYKKNSAFQAKDAFENLIVGFPDSKHIPDAHIYLARVLREVNQPAQSEAVLERFVRDPKYLKHHARALLVLADFEIADEDYIRAQFWLERILRDYRKADEFPNAFFLFGKNYFMQKEYARSLEEFNTFINTRGIAKERKLEARYYIALNLYELGRFDEALREIRYVNRNEIRPDMLSKARVLYGRSLLAENREEDGLQELEAVTKTYPRTAHAAAAYYHWGSYLYYNKQNWDTSITHLNRVRTELSTSEYASLGMNLANAINQTKRPAPQGTSRTLQSFLDYHYQRAESFMGAIALPDSALASFQRVISERDSFVVKADSLRSRLQEAQTELEALLLTLPGDSDSTDSTPETFAQADTLIALADSLAMENPLDADANSTISDSEPSAGIFLPNVNDLEPEPDLPDEILLSDADVVETDSLFIKEELAEFLDESEEADPDIASEPEKPERDSLAIALDRAEVLRQNIRHLEEELEKAEEPLQRFDTEILPYCKYSIFSILQNLPGRENEAAEAYQEMLNLFPRNMYTAAATAILAGRTPNLVDPVQEEAEIAFDLALDYYPDSPDSLVSAMQDFVGSDFEHLRDRANFRLGWHYAFEAPDTTRAKSFLNELLQSSSDPEITDAVRRFFDGQRFLLREANYSYISVETEDDSLLTIPEEIEPGMADGLSDQSAADSLFWDDLIPAETDSLDLVDLIPIQTDSLDAAVAPDSLDALPDSQTDEGEEPGQSAPQTPPLDLIPVREEEADHQ